MTTDDMELLREYALHNSEEAFASLVSRHVNLVYSVGLRQLRDPHLAEEVTQAAFIILARKAGSLGPKTILSAWLCRTAQYVAARLVRDQFRRQRREQEMYMQSLLDHPDSSSWTTIAPLLDGAMAELREKEHSAIVLRFFEGKDLKQVGTALGVSENAANKRVNRALEKLRRHFSRRGVNSTTATIAGAISANSVQGAPVALAKSVTAIAITKGATAGSSTLTLIKGAMKLMAWTKMKTAILVGLAVLATAGGVKIAHQSRELAIKTFESKFQITLVPDETLVTGGWQVEPGRRLFFFVTPEWPLHLQVSAPAGFDVGLVQPPPGAPPQVLFTADIVEVPEKDMAELGLKSLFVAPNDTNVSVKYAPAQMKTLMAAFKAHDGIDKLSIPKLTQAGQHILFASTPEVRKISGKSMPVGPSIDLLPTVSPDGKSMDLVGTVQFVTDTK